MTLKININQLETILKTEPIKLPILFSGSIAKDVSRVIDGHRFHHVREKT